MESRSADGSDDGDDNKSPLAEGGVPPAQPSILAQTHPLGLSSPTDSQPILRAHAGTQRARANSLIHDWKIIVRSPSWYPEWRTKTYCVPPCIVKRVLHDVVHLAGQAALIPKPMSSCGTTGSLQRGGAAENAADAVEGLKLNPKSAEQSAGSPMVSSRTTPREPPQRCPHKPLTKESNAAQDASKTAHQESSTQPKCPHPFTVQAGGADDHSPPHTGALWPQQDFSAVPEVPQESDFRNDFAQQHMLSCLQRLGEERREAMFVISLLNFKDYLSKVEAHEAGLFLLPQQLRDGCQQGDFDLMIIHPLYGILLCEIKSVGLHGAAPVTDKALCKRVTDSFQQLAKCENVLRHITADVSPSVCIRKALMFPYISRTRLKALFNKDKKLKKAAWKCLVPAPGVKLAVELCVCSDDVSDRSSPELVTKEVMAKLGDWWSKRMACEKDITMTPDIYLSLVSRLAGPATTVMVHCVFQPRVELRTLGEAVAVLGHRMSLLVLTPGQLDLLRRPLDFVCLTGPPGTGKTLLLVIKGLMWVREGRTVVVVSTRPASLAVSWLIQHQMVQTLKADPQNTQCINSRHESADDRVKFVHCDLYNQPEELKPMLDKLEGYKDQDGRLCVIMDEVNFRGRNVGEASQTLVHELKARVPHLCLWAARVLHADIPPELPVETLTVPLRSAPAVITELKPSVAKFSDVYDYTDSAAPSPFEGLEVIRLRHEGEGHEARWPVECVKCGREVAGVLRRLNVGATGPSASLELCSGMNRPPLQYRDVFVLTRSSQLTDDSAFVNSLRAEKVPMAVIGWLSADNASDWKRRVSDVALGTTDQVTVSSWGAVHGLERKVVVCLPGRWEGVDDDETDEDLQAHDMLHLASRCTTQLVLVEMPRKSASASSCPPQEA